MENSSGAGWGWKLEIRKSKFENRNWKLEIGN